MTDSFGQKLKALRLRAGISQAELAEAAGMDRVSVVRLENGDVDPAWSTVRALAKALGVTCLAFDDDAEAGRADRP